MAESTQQQRQLTQHIQVVPHPEHSRQDDCGVAHFCCMRFAVVGIVQISLRDLVEEAHQLRRPFAQLITVTDDGSQEIRAHSQKRVVKASTCQAQHRCVPVLANAVHFAELKEVHGQEKAAAGPDCFRIYNVVAPIGFEQTLRCIAADLVGIFWCGVWEDTRHCYTQIGVQGPKAGRLCRCFQGIWSDRPPSFIATVGSARCDSRAGLPLFVQSDR
mmetsp:Transcript_37949/g.95080  ORF Transcript_37949/g.95080 Transcript_37949/m.95080 type:complete len:216 (+) Transcript_37949:1423-2070(+)